MTVHSLDPLRDPRWPEFVDRHPNASVFHTSGWLHALQRTYGYEPVAFTTSPPTGELRNAVVFCAVRSWLTGRRLVSLPFSDHCEPLVQGPEDLSALCLFMGRNQRRQGWKYVEMRPAGMALEAEDGFRRAGTFYLHRLDLRPGLAALRRSFHKDCVLRKIRRAEREGLTYEAGRSESLLRTLDGLLRLTRRRHRLASQPLAWFRNVLDCLGEAACIRIASKDGRPVAGILTLSHGQKVVYKYGGSDASQHKLGGMALLLWKTIQDAKETGIEEFDLGRSNCDSAGLIKFKEHWAANRSMLCYWRSPADARGARRDGRWTHLAKQIPGHLPEGARTLVGNLLYRHIG